MNHYHTYSYLDLNTTTFELNDRSYLYRIPPIGIETPSVESLTSLITRLSEAHCVPTSVLISKTISPALKKIFLKSKDSRGLRAFFNRSHALNGYGDMAEDFIQALERLAFQNNLQFLTLSNWKGVLVEKGLLRNIKVWCPLCYQEYRNSKKTVYDHLLWTIKEVNVCPVHQHPLQVTCPHCGRENTWLTWDIRVGYCPNCQCWLGTNYRDVSSNISEWDLWVARNVGDLLAMEPLTLLTPFDVRQAVFQLVNGVTHGNITAFARLLKMPKNTIWSWYTGKVSPSLLALLKMSYLFQIPLRDFLTNQYAPALRPIPINNSPLKNSQRQSPLSGDLHQIEMVLSKVLAQPAESLPTIKELADSLGIHRRVLNRHFSDLCKALVDKRRQYRRTVHLSTIEQCCEEVRRVTLTLYQQDEYPSEQRVAAFLTKPGYLRYKQVRMAFIEARRALKIDP